MSVGVNSLGYAGTHAVKREEDLELIKKVGPTKILEDLAANETAWKKWIINI